MQWGNGALPMTIKACVSLEAATVAAQRRLQQWNGNVAPGRSLPDCYVTYAPNGERVYTATLEGVTA